MTDLLQLVFSGLAQGTIYGLVALGFVAIFAVREIVNLVQGEYAALAGLAAISAVGAGLPLLVAIVCVIPLVVGVAVLLERMTIAPVKKMTPLTSIILTLGVSTAVKAVMLLIWGPEAKGLPNFPGSDMTLGGVSIRSQELWVLGIGALVAYAVIWFYEHTVRGKSLRACAEQPIAARLVGISPRTATVVGLTSLRVAMIGGMALGVLENLVAGYLSSGYRDAVAFVVLVLVLLFRPNGLAGKTSAVRV